MSLLTATGEASQFSGKVDLEIKLGVHVFKRDKGGIVSKIYFLKIETLPPGSTNIFTLANIKYPST
jgi:hypothetical protein